MSLHVKECNRKERVRLGTYLEAHTWQDQRFALDRLGVVQSLVLAFDLPCVPQ